MVKAVVTSAKNEVTVQFDSAPLPAVRQLLKTWRFRFDGAAWTRDAGINWGNFLSELDRFRSVEWTFGVEKDGKLVPARVEWVPGKAPRLVVDESATEETIERHDERTARVIRALRCWECGQLTAVDPREQTELTRRQREAVERAVAELRAADQPPYLAAAPIPDGVIVVGQGLCAICRSEGS